MIAAELPDVDYVYRLGGPLVYFQHHRGWTHALWSLPLQAALVTGLFFVVHVTRHIWKKHRSLEEPAPARWLLLWLMALAALCSHVALDWTNNYGVRPLAPLNWHWFAGGLFFIVEPTLLAGLALALLVPLALSMTHREAGIRRTPYPGQAFAAAALLLLVFMLIQRWNSHGDAESLAYAQQVHGGQVLRADVSPYPATSEAWHVALETAENMQAGALHLKTHTFDTDPQAMFPRRADTAVVTAAKQSWLGKVFMDWSTYPLVRDAGPAGYVHPGMKLAAVDAAYHVVQFSDLRFRYDTLFMSGAGDKGPLRAEAWVDSNLHVRRIYLGDAEQSLP